MEEHKQKSWFSRNWIWVVPTGGCLLFIIGMLVFAGGLIWGVSSMITDSDAYEISFQQASTNAEVIELLGEPIEQDGMTSGNIEYKNGRKSSELGIPIKGPKGKGMIYVVGVGKGDNWSYSVMEVYIESVDTTIDLLPLPPPEER